VSNVVATYLDLTTVNSENLRTYSFRFT